MTNLPNKENIELNAYRFNEAIIAEVIQQLQKDILLSGGELEIFAPAFHDLNILMEIITGFINHISISNAQLLFNLFYRVDIPQQIIADQPEVMAELVIKRELLKVLTRKFYGK